MSDSPRSVPDWVVALAAKARETDGAPPFSDQAMVDFRLGTRELVTVDSAAVALVAVPEALEDRDAEFVVDPDLRRHGFGTAMLDQLLASGVTKIWAHGDHAGARALAESHRLTPTRELLHFVGPVPNPSATSGTAEAVSPTLAPARPVPDDSTNRSAVPVVIEGLGTFAVGRDEDEWVALNSETFAFHPEQGSVTREDVEQLEAEDWFSADNFLVLRRDGRMIGYCWLKVEAGSGEFYVVGVSPDHQGEHLGSILFDAGLARLADLGIQNAHLYVEADNEPALRLYRARGFHQDSIDIQYSRSPFSGVWTGSGSAEGPQPA